MGFHVQIFHRGSPGGEIQRYVSFWSISFSNVTSKHLPQLMQSCIGNICLIFLLSEFSSASSVLTRSWIMTLIASFLHSKQLDLSDGLWPYHHLTDGEQSSKNHQIWRGTQTPSANHRKRWLPPTIPFKGDCCIENHKKDVNLTKSGPALPNIQNITE